MLISVATLHNLKGDNPPFLQTGYESLTTNHTSIVFIEVFKNGKRK